MFTDIHVTQTCLLVCEDAYDKEIFKRALRDVSPKTKLFHASNAFEAFCKLAAENMAPTFIFVELQMRFIDGVEFLQRIKRQKEFKTIPVIIHSSSPARQRIDELRKYGAWAIQFKPYEYYSLCNILKIYFGLGTAGVWRN